MKTLKFTAVFLLSIMLLSGCSQYLNESMMDPYLENTKKVKYSGEGWKFTFRFPGSEKPTQRELKLEGDEIAHVIFSSGLLSAVEVIVLPHEEREEAPSKTTDHYDFFISTKGIPEKVEAVVMSTFKVNETTIDASAESTES